MIRAESESSPKEVGSEMLNEGDHCKQLSPCHTIATFWFAQHSAGIRYGTFCSIILDLG